MSDVCSFQNLFLFLFWTFGFYFGNKVVCLTIVSSMAVSLDGCLCWKLWVHFFSSYSWGTVSLKGLHYPSTPLFGRLPGLEFCIGGALLLDVDLSWGESKNMKEVSFLFEVIFWKVLGSLFFFLSAFWRGDSRPWCFFFSLSF